MNLKLFSIPKVKEEIILESPSILIYLPHLDLVLPVKMDILNSGHNNSSGSVYSSSDNQFTSF